MKFGDSVVFTENEVEYAATVLAVRHLDDHAGADDEPLLSLGFFAEVKGPDGKSASVMGTNRQSELVQFRLDVAHESHEFSDIAKRKFHSVYNGTTQNLQDEETGAVTSKHIVNYPGGRWREVEMSSFTGTVFDEGDR